MPQVVGWDDIAIRLVLALLAGGVIGLNRSERDRPAGLRTTILVCLAAAISMVQVNMLLNMQGKEPDSFVVLDLMRLPLGILSGMGFIGGGAILRRGDMVKGVTTAATLWFVTVMGLCFGGGQISLGFVALGMAIVVLSGLKIVEDHMPVERRAKLLFVLDNNAPNEGELRQAIADAGMNLASCAVAYAHQAGLRKMRCEVHCAPGLSIPRLLRVSSIWPVCQGSPSWFGSREPALVGLRHTESGRR